MNLFEKNASEKAEANYDRMRAWAEIDNTCVDDATALESQLTKYLSKNATAASLVRREDTLTVTRADGMTLVITVKDHMHFEIDYPGSNDVMADHRKIYGSRHTEKNMTINVVDWLKDC